ncbi:DNA translocase FtsK [Rossellomorea marisflavi]|uniref:Cell division protein FtsK n=1 Tax=Rossellomorea marisflavi TaxID=189381 RepID=A0A0J5SNM6_9BACI|nr:DNA translocase FtsK [Rossellomorea marisflavi]KMK96461.1 cell division protein FtsK [Rossellomorea marisflavi]KML06498.1 cell division protein FtsK [Rossellomorea marisflavi]KZE49868.1 cell division protein FtsK [Rossellomorea marisflavi]MCM2604556.1 DNA translocase FtsK [Rossellomorea marisflavi]QHA36199.1 cell division protein FtsK [Rossellomorea marisflavi]
MAKKKKRKKKGSNTNALKQTIKYEITGLMLLTLSLISVIKLGAVGRAVVHFFRFFMGEWYMAALLLMIYIAGYLMVKREVPLLFSRRLVGIYIIVASFLLLSHVKLFDLLSNDGAFEHPSVIMNTWDLYWMDIRGESSTSDIGGGMIGSVLFAVSYFLFDSQGARIMSATFIIIGIILVTGRSLGDVLGRIGKRFGAFITSQWEAFKVDMAEWKEEKAKKKLEKPAVEKKMQEKETKVPSVDPIPDVEPQVDTLEPIISNFAEKAYAHERSDKEEPVAGEPKDDSTDKGVQDDAPPITFTEVENKDYKLPSISLLKSPKKTDQSNEYQLIHANAAKLERTFQSFGVKAKVTQVHLGPAVTKYEVHPDVGVKVSRIVNLSDDLALALAAKDIRIEAPIPGKSAIGIEVPNSEVAMVSLREVLESKEKNKPDSKLQIGLGRDITGEAVLAELNKMPHLLVAGATGSGKSVCINGIITSILMRAKPHEVKLMMIDPKMVELNVYNGVPHLLAPVVTEPKRASQALKKVVNEMERRYELFSHTGTRNIEGYNDYVKRQNLENEDKQPLLPYIVVIVDELADLMMVASNDVEDAITRLAQMARAAGIHLIIATQRPSVDVITGVIKANIPSRIAFAVSSMTDSRTILDSGGAEKLLGRGDMLFMPVGASKPTRVQGAFLSDEEVEEVVDFVISQQKAQYQEEMIPDEVQEESGSGEAEDELYDDAVQLIAEMQTASVSMLQRRFRIGYTRAARIIDEMEVRGVVGPYEGSKPRSVLVGKPSEEQSS